MGQCQTPQYLQTRLLSQVILPTILCCNYITKLRTRLQSMRQIALILLEWTTRECREPYEYDLLKMCQSPMDCRFSRNTSVVGTEII
jgi:hypothetical protein